MCVEFVSEGCRDIFGYEPSFFVGRDLLEFKRLIHPDDMNRMLETVRNAIAERKPFACEYRILTASDETKWVFDKAEPVFGEADETVALEGFMADFTVYKNLEHNLRDENLLLRSTIKDRYKFKNIIGNCRAMQDVFELILKAATTDDNVIIHGESGTGKELVAQAIHDASSRKNNSFVAVSCAAIPESLIESEFFGMSKGAFTGAYADKKGYLEASGNGSLFLDEIGEISLSMQAKLLRAIDGGGFSPVGSTRVIRPNLRIIAASNKNLEALVGSGDMRQDFYFRVNVIPIHLPPLRERGDDILMLINHFLKLYSAADNIITLPREDLETLKSYHWPGNIRELQNVLRRYIALKNLRFMKIPSGFGAEEKAGPKTGDLPDSGTLRGAVDQYEKNMILKTLGDTKWNKTRAAEMLGVSRKTLFRKMKNLELM